MEKSVQISTRLILFVIAFLVLYFYLSDKIKQPDFKEAATKYLEPIMGNNKTHSLFNLIENYSNTFAATLASSSITFVANLPVRF